MGEKIKILLTIRQGLVGGGETHVLDLVKGMDKDLFTPIVLSFTDGEMVTRLKEIGIKCYVIPTIKPFDVRVWNKVKKLALKENIQLIHAHGTRACSNSFWAAVMLDIPIFYTVHGWSFHPNQSKFTKKMRELGEAFLCNNVQKTICVSRSCLNEGLQRFNIPNAVIINNGVNLEKYNPEGKFIDVRSALGIPKQVTLVGFIARMTGQKDPLTMMEAIRRVAEKNKEIHFLLVGDGDQKQAMVDFATKYDLHAHITFQGFRKDVPALLNAIDVYCLPSLWEGLPIGILEAMAMKKCVIASAVAGNDELIADKVNGLLVPVKNPEKLSEAILFLHEQKELKEVFGKASHGIVLNKYNLLNMTKEVQDLVASHAYKKRGLVVPAYSDGSLETQRKKPESLDVI